MTNIEKLARLIVKTGDAEKIMKALEIGLKVETKTQNVRRERAQLGVRQVAVGFDPTDIHQQGS